MTTKTVEPRLPTYTTSVSDPHYIAGPHREGEEPEEWYVIRKGVGIGTNRVVAICATRFDADKVCAALNVIEELRQRATDVFFDRRG